MKDNVMLSLDMDLYNALKEDYKVSNLVNIMMESYVSDETKDVTLTLHLNQIDIAIETLTEKLRSAERIIEETTSQIKYLAERRDDLKRDFAYAKELRVRNKYYSEFNGLCINCDFIIEEVEARGAELIQKIKLVDPTFDPKARMERYKRLLDDF